MLPIKQMQMVGRQKLHIIFPDRNGWVVRAAMLVIKSIVDTGNNNVGSTPSFVEPRE